MKTIGFVGLGLMGSRMAMRLLEGGHRLIVYNRTEAKASGLLDAGAQWADSPSDAARGADVVWTMLSTPKVVETAALGANGFLPAMNAGALWINSSTVDPLSSRRLAAASNDCGVRFLDVPVSGSTGAAEESALVMLAGGDAADVEGASDLLLAVGRKVIYAGGHGQGSALKLVFNQLLGTALLGASEAVVLGESLGLERKALFTALEDCGALPPGLRSRVRSSIDDATYEPGFPLQWIEKDLRLVAQAGAENGAVLPMTDAARSVYGLARANGWGERGLTAVFEFLRGNRIARSEQRKQEQE